MTTEGINPLTANLDLLEPLDLVRVIAEDQRNAVEAVLRAQTDIARAVERALVIRRGGHERAFVVFRFKRIDADLFVAQ
jgi:N-acetylmuramic acid 6-phosphate etherase